MVRWIGIGILVLSGGWWVLLGACDGVRAQTGAGGGARPVREADEPIARVTTVFAIEHFDVGRLAGVLSRLVDDRGAQFLPLEGENDEKLLIAKIRSSEVAYVARLIATLESMASGETVEVESVEVESVRVDPESESESESESERVASASAPAGEAVELRRVDRSVHFRAAAVWADLERAFDAARKTGEIEPSFLLIAPKSKLKLKTASPEVDRALIEALEKGKRWNLQTWTRRQLKDGRSEVMVELELMNDSGVSLALQPTSLETRLFELLEAEGHPRVDSIRTVSKKAFRKGVTREQVHVFFEPAACEKSLKFVSEIENAGASVRALELLRVDGLWRAELKFESLVESDG